MHCVRRRLSALLAVGVDVRDSGLPWGQLGGRGHGDGVLPPTTGLRGRGWEVRGVSRRGGLGYIWIDCVMLAGYY